MTMMWPSRSQSAVCATLATSIEGPAVRDEIPGSKVSTDLRSCMSSSLPPRISTSPSKSEEALQAGVPLEGALFETCEKLVERRADLPGPIVRFSVQPIDDLASLGVDAEVIGVTEIDGKRHHRIGEAVHIA